MVEPELPNSTKLQRKITDIKLVLREKKQNNDPKECFSNEKEFELKLFYHDNKPIIKDFNYKYLFHLSLILGGIGKRARRGRGCMSSDFTRKMTKAEQIKFVAEQLNNINGNVENQIYTVK